MNAVLLNCTLKRSQAESNMVVYEWMPAAAETLASEQSGVDCLRRPQR